MSSALTTIQTDKPAQPAIKPPKRQRSTRISAQLKAAIDAMVWQGMKRDAAAQHAGMKDNSLYVAFRRPDVKAAYLAECEVLRTSGRARRIHRLEAMLEQDDNKAAVINAALALDRMPDEMAGGRGNASLPGLQIVIVQGGNDARLTQVSADTMKTIEQSSD